MKESKISIKSDITDNNRTLSYNRTFSFFYYKSTSMYIVFRYVVMLTYLPEPHGFQIVLILIVTLTAPT